MDRQQVYETVRNHLLSQNKRSLDSNGSCLYRSKDGLKCAIGALIPDELYTKELEGGIPENYRIKTVLEKSMGCTLEIEDLIFLTTLQKIHDLEMIHEWEACLDKFARVEGLKARSQPTGGEGK